MVITEIPTRMYNKPRPSASPAIIGTKYSNALLGPKTFSNTTLSAIPTIWFCHPYHPPLPPRPRRTPNGCRKNHGNMVRSHPMIMMRAASISSELSRLSLRPYVSGESSLWIECFLCIREVSAGAPPPSISFFLISRGAWL